MSSWAESARSVIAITQHRRILLEHQIETPHHHERIPTFKDEGSGRIMPDCVPSSFENVTDYTAALCRFIETPFFKQITDGIHVNDAFIYNAWETLPEEWREWWSGLSHYSLAQRDLIDSVHGTSPQFSKISARPIDLTEWLAEVRSLSLHRDPSDELAKAELPYHLQQTFATKKIAEVTRSVAYIARMCQRLQIIRIVDIGSGQGYLPIALAYLHPELQILAMDGDSTQIAGSKRLASSLEIAEDRLVHVVQYVDDVSSLKDTVEMWSKDEPCILIGLHSCGSLSEHMIRAFVETPCIKALAVVGCCYNQIQRRSDSFPNGFPISQKLRDANIDLTSTALMAGCQTPGNWPSLTNASGPVNSPFVKRHFYRAVFEKILFDRGLRADHPERSAWAIRKVDMVNFEAFCRRAMQTLNIDEACLSNETLRRYEEEYASREGEIAILRVLSVLPCKVVESVVAMDRYWYLVEQGLDRVDVLPIYDYAISPRNLMIIAEKDAD